MQRISRRTFVVGTAAVAAATQIVARQRSEAHGYRVFNPIEARFIEAACERLIPVDADCAGANEAGVPHHIDARLAEAPTAAAATFGIALAAIIEDARARVVAHAHFADWPVSTQMAYLQTLETGITLGDRISSRQFFQTLLAFSVDAYLSHPIHGPRRERFQWPVCGLAGAWSPLQATAGRPWLEQSTS